MEVLFARVFALKEKEIQVWALKRLMLAVSVNSTIVEYAQDAMWVGLTKDLSPLTRTGVDAMTLSACVLASKRIIEDAELATSEMEPGVANVIRAGHYLQADASIQLVRVTRRANNVNTKMVQCVLLV
jgi:hypothetical protein